MRVTLTAAAKNHIGNSRANNEDNLYLQGFYLPLKDMDAGCEKEIQCSDAVQVYAVCDGIGGAEAGEQASCCAVSMLHLLNSRLRGIAPESRSIRNVLTQINAKICEIPAKRGAGSTMALLCIRRRRATVVNIGDSRVYFLRGGILYRLTKDHTEWQQLVNLGIEQEENAVEQPSMHTLSRYLGMMPELFATAPEYSESIHLEKDDRFLLCSDGLHGCVTDALLAEALQEAPAQALHTLTEAALKNGGNDNITGIVLHVESV